MSVSLKSWYSAYVAVGLVSALPNLLLFLIPSSVLTKKGSRGLNYHNMMMSFAAAGLLGDVFLHTLPHLIAPHNHSHGDHTHSEAHEKGHEHEHHDHEDHHDSHEHHDHHEHDHHHDHLDDRLEHEHHRHDDHHHGSGGHHDHAHDEPLFAEHHNHNRESEHALPDDYYAVEGHGHHEEANIYASFFGLERTTIIALVLLLGFLVFMFAEKMATQHQHGHHHHGDDDKHSDDEIAEQDGQHADTNSTPATSTDGTTTATRRSARVQGRTASAQQQAAPAQQAANTEQDEHKPPTSLFQAMRQHLQASGWLNLLADSMHNFTDGIALGASFASGKGLAYATFLSVIFHEIPHEIGDFAILVQSGLSKSQAIQAQFVTALAAVAGTSVGLLARRSEVLEELLLAFTAGGFLYLATVNMLPTIVRSRSSTMQNVLEMLCFALGVGMMVAVTFLE